MTADEHPSGHRIVDEHPSGTALRDTYFVHNIVLGIHGEAGVKRTKVMS